MVHNLNSQEMSNPLVATFHLYTTNQYTWRRQKHNNVEYSSLTLAITHDHKLDTSIALSDCSPSEMISCCPFATIGNWNKPCKEKKGK